MPLNLARTLKTKLQKRVSTLACNTVLYNWSLGGCVPDKILVSPVDLWPGSAERGKWLIETGTFEYSGDRLELHNADWEPKDIEPTWFEHLHSHVWLRDLKALNGNEARRAARAMVQSWIDEYPVWDERSWRADILGARIANWITFYDFFGESADDDFQFILHESLARQTRHLVRAITGSVTGLGLLYAIKGLAYAGLALEGRESCLEQALNLMDKEIDKQILSDGGHVSRSPQALMEAIQILIDLRTALQAGGYPGQEKIQHALDRAVPALRFFRHGDRKFALFNGCQEGDEDIMKAILLQARSKARTLSSLPHTGYERISMGRALLMMDTGKPAAYPYDKKAHAAPLSFEFSYGRERVLTNCGTHPTSEDWKNALRFTPAHNAIAIDDRNACEVGEDGHFLRRPRVVQSTREDMDGSVLIDACHDGYVPLNGITHRRRIFMAEQGHDLRGEETLNCAIGLSRPVSLAMRFHLHPDIPVSLVNEDREALLRVKNGPGWRFTVSGGTLRLENSIYLGEGIRPRKSKQLVIYTQMTEDFTQIKWALQQESS
ncbi:MAG: heparinase II/III family protein [Pseudomonadota bacterium]